MKKKTFAVIGGDLRQAHLAARLAGKGHKVKTLLLDKEIELSSKVKRAESVEELSACDVLIFGLPMCGEGTKIHAPFSDQVLTVEDCFKHVSPHTLILGGRVSKLAEELAKTHELEVMDYLEREELAVLNAVPTAEGCIDIIMQELPTTIFGQKILITGFGRIAKVLCRILVAMGAQVLIAARKYSDLAWIKIYGAQAIHMSLMDEFAAGADVIINTVPAVILDHSILSLLSRDCLVIDLASKPGGVDFETARSLGIKTIWALSLPGKVAPLTAGEIISEAVLNIIEERGE